MAAWHLYLMRVHNSLSAFLILGMCRIKRQKAVGKLAVGHLAGFYTHVRVYKASERQKPLHELYMN
ncbi:isomerase [Clarias magur]|uniref:Isomerase n=1 Tax=Clarias magur TaxID=1594786 RepID=A0A8J4WWC6_CLAMG|nr:isomerase [Clarias magur]